MKWIQRFLCRRQRRSANSAAGPPLSGGPQPIPSKENLILGGESVTQMLSDNLLPSLDPQPPLKEGSALAFDGESVTNMLSDDILAQIFSFLGESTASHSIFGKRIFRKPSTLSCKTENVPQAVLGAKTISSIAHLCNQVAPVCSRWNNVCNDRLSSFVGLVDADLIPTIGCNRLMVPVLKWMCDHKLRLRSMRLCNAKSYVPVTATILQKQDMVHLKELHLVYGSLHDSDATLAKAIAEECGALETLHVRFERGCEQTIQHHRLSPPYLALPIKTLILDVTSTHPQRLELWIQFISGMKNLKHLRILGETTPFRIIPRDPIHIKSETLLSLDVTELPYCWTFCQCPKLERFSCRSAGIERTISWRSDDSVVVPSGSLPRLSKHQFDNLPFDGIGDLEVAACAMPFLGIDVPPSCLLTLKQFWGRRGFDDYTMCLNKLETAWAEEEPISTMQP